MPLPADISLPTLVFLAALAFLVLVLVRRMLRRAARPSNRDAAQMIASVQADRDVMRAKHAVEVAALERELANARGNLPPDLKEASRVKQLERELAEAKTALAARPKAAGTSQSAEAEGLRVERDEARTEAERAVAALDYLRGEYAALEARLAQASAAQARVEEVAKEAATLREREAALRTSLGERDARLKELQGSAAAASSDGASEEIKRLNEALKKAEVRERVANESLSRMAYDKDGLEGRLAAADQAEGRLKAELERRDTLIELRTEKIYALEADLRAADAAASEAEARAKAAEAAVAVARRGGDRSELLEELEALANRAAEAGAEREATGVNGASYGAGSALNAELDSAHDEIARLRSENESLRRAASSDDSTGGPADVGRDDAGQEIGSDDVEELKATLRALATRFVTEAEAAGTSDARDSLAERIKAFKASRGAAGASGADGR